MYVSHTSLHPNIYACDNQKLIRSEGMRRVGYLQGDEGKRMKGREGWNGETIEAADIGNLGKSTQH